MDFSDALRAMKTGAKVRRVAWSGDPAGTPVNRGNTMEIIRVTVENQTVPMLFARRVDGSLLPFGGSQWDLLGDDWEIVDDE
jgi:Protein of unknown function (DUF2829)